MNTKWSGAYIMHSFLFSYKEKTKIPWVVIFFPDFPHFLKIPWVFPVWKMQICFSLISLISMSPWEPYPAEYYFNIHDPSRDNEIPL